MKLMRFINTVKSLIDDTPPGASDIGSFSPHRI